MVIIFFTSHGIVQKEFVLPGVTVNQKYYLEMMNCLRKRVMQVQMEIANNWILLASSQQCAHPHCNVSL
jgi:hypothetical protein